jgi:hypothetical protein
MRSARSSASSRPTGFGSDPGSVDRLTPRPHRPRTMCSSRSIPQRRRRMTPRLWPTLAKILLGLFAAAQRVARTSRGKFSRGGRTTAGCLGLSALRRATPSWTLAAAAAGQRRRRVHASPACGTDGAALGYTVSAVAAAVAHERAIRRRLQRGEAPRHVRRRCADRRADDHCATLVGRRHQHRLLLGVEQCGSRCRPGASVVARRGGTRVRKHALRQMRGALRHAPSTATGTHRPALA